MLQSFWVLASTFLTVLTYVFVKPAPEGTWFGDVFLVRSLFLFGVLCTLAAVRRVPLATRNAGWHAFRSVFGVTALLLNIVTVQHLPIGTAQTLTFTAPLFVAAFSVIRSLLRGRPINIGLVAAVLAGFAGICLTMRPSLDAAMTAFCALALFSAALAASTSLALKKLGSLGEPVVRTAFYFGCASLAASVALWCVGSEKSLAELLLTPELLAVGLTTVGAQLAQTQGWATANLFFAPTCSFPPFSSASPAACSFLTRRTIREPTSACRLFSSRKSPRRFCRPETVPVNPGKAGAFRRHRAHSRPTRRSRRAGRRRSPGDRARGRRERRRSRDRGPL